MKKQPEQKKEPELKVTSGKELRAMRERGVVITLYSGRTVRMRAVSPDAYLEELDGTPEIFQHFILDLFWKGDAGDDVSKFLEPRQTAKETRDAVISMGIVAKRSLLEPVIVDELTTDDDREEILIGDLFGGELGIIFRLAFCDHAFLYHLEATGLPTSDDIQLAEPALAETNKGASAS